jgi:hypothetical protein
MTDDIQATPAPPDTKSWFEYAWKLEQDSPNRFEDAAKFLATMISLSLTIIITAIEKLKILTFHPIIPFIALLVWIVSLFFAFYVLMPQKYTFHSQSVDTIKEAHQKIVQTKRTRFVISAVLYFIPFVFLSLSYLISFMR